MCTFCEWDPTLYGRVENMRDSSYYWLYSLAFGQKSSDDAKWLFPDKKYIILSQGNMRVESMVIRKYHRFPKNTKLNAKSWSIPLTVTLFENGFENELSKPKWLEFKNALD